MKSIGSRSGFARRAGRAGRATPAALLIGALGVGLLLVFGLGRTGSDADDPATRDAQRIDGRATAGVGPGRADADAGSGLAERIGRDRAAQAERAAALAAAAAGDESASDRRDRPAGPSGTAGAVEKLAAFQAAQRARRGPWKPGRSMQPDPGTSAESSPTTGTGDGASTALGVGVAGGSGRGDGAGRGEAGRPLGAPPEPGAVEVLGVVSRTPAHDAGLRRGMRILEFDGQPVVDRASLEAAASASAAAGAASVPVLVEDRRGEIFVLDLAPDVSGALLSPGGAP